VLFGNECVIDVGSHAAIPDVPDLREARPLSHIEALELDELPPHLIVLCGSHTGTKMDNGGPHRRTPPFFRLDMQPYGCI
jgi:pyruvate/2-oxoglutarate dehydrogenase complex dihydrolipoamide dehydrogenase (E3) component